MSWCLAPLAPTAVLRDNQGTGTSRYHKPTELDAGPLAGTWTLHVDDETGGQTGNLRGWSLTVFTEGGGHQISPRAVWTSSVSDLEVEGTVEAIDMVDARHVLPPGSAAELYVRTCDVPDGCAAAAWSGPFVPARSRASRRRVTHSCASC